MENNETFTAGAMAMAEGAAFFKKRTIAVDFDGTLVEYHGWQGNNNQGVLVKPLMDIIQKLHAQGHEFHIFSARACDEEGWRHIDKVLCYHDVRRFFTTITDKKLKIFTEFWDDRAMEIIPNTGKFALEDARDAFSRELNAQDAYYRQELKKAGKPGHIKDHALHVPMNNQSSPVESPMDIQVGGNHYKKYAIQPIEFVHKNKIPPVEASVIKYACRHGDKNGVEDLRKAKHLLEMLARMQYGVDI